MSDAPLLTLVQWLSPAFPLGGYAYSHGLETALASGRPGGAAAVGGWIGDVIAHGSARVDAALLAQALAPGADHAALAALARALAASRERAQESEEQGAAFTRTLDALTGTAQVPLPLPVALGRAAAALGLPVDLVLSLWLQAFAQNLVQIAQRLAPLGQTEAQLLLTGLRPLILQVAAEVAAAPEELGSAGFGADIAAMAHEVQEVRLCRT